MKKILFILDMKWLNYNEDSSDILIFNALYSAGDIILLASILFRLILVQSFDIFTPIASCGGNGL